jgi:hypothetical protein
MTTRGIEKLAAFSHVRYDDNFWGGVEPDMAKVVVEKLSKRSESRSTRHSISEKRVRDSAGKSRMIRTIDAESPTFGDDLRYIFAQNVRKARRDNKRLIGTPDVVLPKP